jgi:hypothetical protein
MRDSMGGAFSSAEQSVVLSVAWQPAAESEARGLGRVHGQRSHSYANPRAALRWLVIHER